MASLLTSFQEREFRGGRLHRPKSDERLDDNWNFWMVQKTEGLVYDMPWAAAVATGTLSSFAEITNLEPQWEEDPWRSLYQVRVGVDIGQMYVEMLAGTVRRTPYMIRRPSASTPQVGYFDEKSSPFIDPYFEVFLRHNEKPAFAVYNKYGMSITPKLHFIGRKLMCCDLMNAKSAKYLNLDPGKMSSIIQRCKDQTIAHRRITMLGIER